MRLGYKASAEQFGPGELLGLAVAAERAGLDSVAVSDHFQPWRHSSGHAPSSLAWLGAAGQATGRVALGDERAHADAPLPAGGGRAGVRDAGLPLPGARHPRRRHRRGDERDAGDRGRVAGREGAAPAARRGDRADPRALERRARQLRGRLLPHRPRDDLRPAGRAGADLRRRLRAARGEARRSCRGRLHLHERQGRRPLPRAAGRGRGGRARGRTRPGVARADDRDQGLLRPRPRLRARGVQLVGRARAHARGEERRRGPDRDGAPGRRAPRPRPHPLHRLRRPAGGRRADPLLRRPRLRPPRLPRPRATTSAASSSSSPPTCCRCSASARPGARPTARRGPRASRGRSRGRAGRRPPPRGPRPPRAASASRRCHGRRSR